jgi:hypothetical protein
MGTIFLLNFDLNSAWLNLLVEGIRLQYQYF